MKTVGEILKEKRIQKNITLDEIEKAIKIRKKFLEALENGDFEKLPGETYVSGFVKNYASYLGLSTEFLMAILRRQYYERQKKELIPQGLEKPLIKSPILSKIVAIPAVFIFAMIILSVYLYVQYAHFQSSPRLIVSQPAQNITIKKDSFFILGTADKEARIFLNGQEITLDENGAFNEKILLQEGDNQIIIVAVNKLGKESRVERIITRKN